ncbi:MAG TPA: OsmC family protein [Bryobacteraceae bacterium]|nr:OsmC family protein [Bryobacteraceae bacterium]
MNRTATAEWRGGLRDGKGSISTQSGVLKDSQYSFATRFENGIGTNPEELIAAAHAGCFSMALSLILSEYQMTAESIRTKATVSLEKVGEAFSITKSHLDLVARIPGANEEKFQEAAEKAKQNCPVSKVLKAELSLNAKLES